MQNPPPVAELMIELTRFMAEMEQLVDLPESDWSWRPNSDDWSLTEVLCHLRDVEREVHQSRLKAVLAGDMPFLAGVDADQWAIPRGYCDQNGRQALQDFVEARGETIRLLQAQPPEAWQRQGQHSFFGPTSLHELVSLAVRHDLVHRQQIDNLLQRKLS